MITGLSVPLLWLGCTVWRQIFTKMFEMCMSLSQVNPAFKFNQWTKSMEQQAGDVLSPTLYYNLT